MTITVINPTNKIDEFILSNGSVKLNYCAVSGEVFIAVSIRDRNNKFYIDNMYHGNGNKLPIIESSISDHYGININILQPMLDQVIDEICNLPIVRAFEKAGIPVSDQYKPVRYIAAKSGIHGLMSDKMNKVCEYPGTPIANSVLITDPCDKIANQLITIDHKKYKFKSSHLNCGKAIIPLLLVNQISTPESIIEAANGLFEFFCDVISNTDGVKLFSDFKRSLGIHSDLSLRDVLYKYNIFELLEELYNQINEVCYDKNRTK